MTVVIGGVLALLLAIFGNVLASEVYEWLPTLAARIVRLAAARLPRMSDRYQERWSADLDEIPGHSAKASVLSGCSCVCRSLDVTCPGRSRRTLLSNSATSRRLCPPSSARSAPGWSLRPISRFTCRRSSLRLAGAPPQVVIGMAAASTMAAIHEGWKSTSSSSGYNPHHYDRDPRHHPAYGTTISQVILPLEGTKNESK